jgi:hypothetical protein
MKLSKQPRGLQFIKIADNAYAKLYDTNIFTQIGNKITLNSGGWRTMHTKKCMNLIFKDLGLPIYVQQKNGYWNVNLGGGVILPFVDGIEINL